VSNRFPVKIGVIGCGNISGIYLQTAQRFLEIEVAACADLVPERAITKAVEYGVPQACTVDDVLADPKIEIILNLTVPKTHVGISLAALRAGKSVYSEKPLAVTREDGERILATAREYNLRVGCAPDTFLGAGLQTARQLIDAGAIGEPVAATAFMVCHGHEGWHPHPEFYYQVGAGPMLDMGPYYLTALIHLLGPIRRVCGATRVSFPERTITSEPKKGKQIKVDVPTHVTGLLDFASGAVGTIITRFDVWHANLPLIEIHGATGSLSVPDPNGFGGPVRIRRAGEDQWSDIPLAFDYPENSRGLGVADLAHALRTGRPHRACGELAQHVLDVMHAIHESSDTGAHINVTTTCARPAPFPTGLAPGCLDD